MLGKQNDLSKFDSQKNIWYKRTEKSIVAQRAFVNKQRTDL